MLFDKFNRVHNYLRMSITDACNFRCTYCAPADAFSCLQSKNLMSPDEIETIARTFVDLGVEKIRLTGGEPLIRKDFSNILRRLAQFPVELTLTTNGSFVGRYIDDFKTAGVRSVNVSLDSLRPGRFREITGRDTFSDVWNNILLLIENDIHVKINVVAIKGIIEHEILDFIRLTKTLPLHVRFIEFMPFKGNNWTSNSIVTAEQMLHSVAYEFDVVKLRDEPHSTAKKYKAIGHEGTFAFITTMSNQFCSSCNRLRLTADGKIKNCLFGKDEFDLLTELRNGRPVLPVIQNAIQNKYAAMGGQFGKDYKCTDTNAIINRSMISIGG